MRSPILGLLLVFALHSARASAQPAAASGQLIWPPDCTRDMPRDGLVLLDGGLFAAAGLDVTLRRSADGAPVPGAFEPQPPAAPIRWRSHAALSPDTEYKIEAHATGTPDSPPLVSYFTTGASFLAPLAFSARPAVRVLARAPQAGAAPDHEIVLLRIALPALSGGLPQRTLQVSGALAEVSADEQSAALRSRHAQAAQPGQALGFELEAALRDAPSVRCVRITAGDDLGHELALDPELCVSLPARTGAPPDAEAGDAAHAFETNASQQGPDATTSAVHASTVHTEADGCAVAGTPARATGGWLPFALLLLSALRPRTRNLPG